MEDQLSHRELIVERPSIVLKIRSQYRSLSKKEAAIGDYILSDPKKVSLMTINEIAEALDIAPSTVFQFTRKLGYAGFRDFRNDLLAEEFDPAVSIHENVQSSDDALSIAHKVFASSMKSLQDTNSLLDSNALEKASEILLAARMVSFFGVGGSNVVAYDAYHKFLRSPVHVQYGTDSHIQRMQASLLTPADCAVITTHSGLTKDTINIAQAAHKTGARIISITSYLSAPLDKISDVTFVSTAEETGFRSESLSSRIAQLAIIDSLFTIVMLKNEAGAIESLQRIRNVISPTKEEAI